MNRPRHLEFLTAPLILGMCILLLFLGKGAYVPSICVLMLGQELFDLGWHSRQHHPHLWLAKRWVWMVGVIMCAGAVKLLP